MPAGRLRALRRAPYALLAIAMGVLGVQVPLAHADADSLTVSVASTQAIVPPDSDVTVTVELGNSATTPLAAANITVALSSSALTDAAAVEAWMAGSGQASSTVVRASSLPTPASGSTSTGLTVPATAFTAEGAWGIEAQVSVSGTSHTARSVVSVRSSVAQATVSTVVALTVTEPGDGLFDADTLSTLTASDGELTLALNALLGQTVTVGIDPRILASIRALGAQAPATATAWLATLQNAGFDTFALQYADADPGLQAQLGLEQPLSPGDFSDLGLDASARAGLTSFNYSRSLLWPGSATASNLDWFARTGTQQVLLDSDNVSASHALSHSGSMSVLQAQSSVSAALGRALSATNTGSSLSANNVLQAELAMYAGSHIVLAPNRPTIGARASSALSIVASSPVSRGVALSTLASSGTATVLDRPESADRLAISQHVLDRSAALTAFSPVAVTPSDLTEPDRRKVLALFATGWIGAPAAFSGAVAAYDSAIDQALNSVHVASSSTINVLASEASLPFTVENALSVPVQVRVSVSPSNGRIVVGESVEAEIAPNSRQTVRVPVKARIGNGMVSLNVTLHDRNGTQIGAATVIPANVQADWEGWGAAAIAIVAGVLFAVGVWRQVRKVRRKAALAAEPTDE